MTKKRKTISIVIPTYNSAKRVEKLIKLIKQVKMPDFYKEIIVVNDCSPDATWQKLKPIKGIIKINHLKNTGKGGAVRSGLLRATGDILFIQDDDLEYDPAEIPSLIDPIIKNRAQVVFGSRHLNKKNKYSSLLYYWGGFFVNQTISLLLGTRLTDPITGSKAFTKEVYELISPIESNGFEIEAEITAKVVKRGIKLLEIPINYFPRTRQQGKNIRWHHAFPILKTLLKNSLLS